MKFRLFFIILAIMTGISCSKEKTGDRATINVRLTDSPANYQEVNIHVIGVEIHTEEDGWTTLNAEPATYNILDLTDGITVLIGFGQVPVGTITQIRLLLGDDNTIMVDDQLYELTTPSAQQSGLKLNVHMEVLNDETYTILLDFDAAKSIVQTGSDKYILKPVIRAILTDIDGAIRGTISPVIAHPLVMAISGLDTVSSFANITSGNFLIQGLPDGIYSVYILPAEPYNDTIISNVAVLDNSLTDLGMIQLHE